MRAYLLLAIILLAVLATGAVGYTKELAKKPLVYDYVAAGDFRALATFYLRNAPNIQEQRMLGAPDAPITIVAYLDPTAASSQVFATAIFPELKTAYIDTGKVRFYHKHRLTMTEYREQTEEYWYAQTLSCIWKQQPTYLYTGASRQETLKTLPHFGVDIATLQTCLNEDHVREDVTEVEHFGIAGISPQLHIGIDGRDVTILNGIVTHAQLQQAIQQYQVQLGD